MGKKNITAEVNFFNLVLKIKINNEILRSDWTVKALLVKS